MVSALPSSTLTEKPKKATSPTPTDRLAKQIRKARLFIYSHVVAAENKVDEVMESAFHLENSFVSTIASLAPPRESGEKLIPGSLYVLVAAMAGSIVARNRNVVLRASLPLAVGVGAGWVVLPSTMRNISDLLWKYEERFPAVADGHMRTREGIEKAWRMAVVHTHLAGNILDEKITSARQAVEGWAQKGK
jgi:organizing structure protein 2